MDRIEAGFSVVKTFLCQKWIILAIGTLDVVYGSATLVVYSIVLQKAVSSESLEDLPIVRGNFQVPFLNFTKVDTDSNLAVIKGTFGCALCFSIITFIIGTLLLYSVGKDYVTGLKIYISIKAILIILSQSYMIASIAHGYGTAASITADTIVFVVHICFVFATTTYMMYLSQKISNEENHLMEMKGSYNVRRSSGSNVTSTDTLSTIQ